MVRYRFINTCVNATSDMSILSLNQTGSNHCCLILNILPQFLLYLNVIMNKHGYKTYLKKRKKNVFIVACKLSPTDRINFVLYLQARFLLSKVNPSQTHNNMYAYGGVSVIICDMLFSSFYVTVLVHYYLSFICPFIHLKI